METFQKEISFLSIVPDVDLQTNVKKIIKKTATFDELSRTAKDQHKLHFKIISVISQSIKGDEEFTIESDGMYDLVVLAINKLLQVNENFTESDKKEFLLDSGAIWKFGMWLLGEKLTPFFSILMQT